MTTHYTDEKNVQIVISLLKQHGIKKVIASPGATNVTFLASIQQDSWFEIYSSVDERSAAYIACGLAAESGEPVVINCTGATSSRNYLPGLTEAFYRKLPIITITSSQVSAKTGHLIAQVTDRTTPPVDTVKYSVTLPQVGDADGVWDCEIKVNRALLESRRNGGGPVHLNLETKYSKCYDVKELPKYRKIDRYTITDTLPELPKGKIAIFIGSHAKMSDEQVAAIDNFCASNDAVAFCDHTSSYRGKYALQFALVSGQTNLDKSKFKPDLLIHIGEVSGDSPNMSLGGKMVWRVNPDGEIRDTFRKLQAVFEMPIEKFFNNYIADAVKDDAFLSLCQDKLSHVRNSVPELPFSNVWIAKQTAHRIPENSTIHFAIYNSLRAWNFFDLPESIDSMSNVGGFGIDGCMSSLIGASLYNPNRLYYLITGDLAFFYDMNVAGNRHVGKNVRIMLVNNGRGTEFRNYNHPAAAFGEEADLYMAAAHHYGSRSPKLIKHYAADLGYEYLSASNKDEFFDIYDRFLESDITDKPMIFEVFTDSVDESDALKAIRHIENTTSKSVENLAKKIIKGVLSKDSVDKLKQKVKK